MNIKHITALPASIVATVRNEINTIESFLKSLLSQSVSPAEIIIVDGASNDGTSEILDKYSKQNKIKVITKDCNIAQGRNAGIREARNNIIAVTDAGCVVTETWLENILKCFLSESQPDVVAGNFRFICKSRFEEAVTLATFPPDRDNTESATYYPSSRSVAFTRDAWKKANGYPEWLYAGEDTLFSFRLRQLGYHFLFAKEAIVYWRPRETWKALFKQRFNYARGNARVGFASHGYLINIKYHVAILIPLLLGFYSPWIALLCTYPLTQHIRLNLLPQATKASLLSGKPEMRWYIVLVMEFVRLANITGFLAGRWDRLTDKSFIEKQKKWMGVESLDDL